MAATIESPFVRPLYVMAKPAGASCNLRCKYCYYLDKTELYPGVTPVMSDAVLERFVRDYIAAQPQEAVMFTWHGGEALLRDRKFYERVLQLQRKYAGGHHIDNSLQTNGTLINDDWCRFFRDNNFLIGLSIDGPQRFHDEFRRDRNGRPTYPKVMRGVELLNRHGVEWNAMAVVNSGNAEYPLEFYRFFRDTLGCRYLQFTPIVERLDGGKMAQPDKRMGEIAPFSVSPLQWGDFLCAIFDEWVRRDVGEMFVQLFDATLANWVGVPPGVCTLAPECGQALVMEFDGSVYSCDHFVYPDHYLGNISNKSLISMIVSERQQEFADKSRKLPGKCLKCRYLFACNGECPKNRISVTECGEPGLNYLCEGYHRFFAHSERAMRFMRNEYVNNRPPSNIMYAPSY